MSIVLPPPAPDLRVLDLTDERGLLCGKILADLGAEVIHVEPPGGSSARRVPPAPLWWAAYTGGQRSVVLDLRDEPGVATLHRLLAEVDVLVESFAPGSLAGLGLDPAEIERRHPHLVHASISPFGSSGPRATQAATDLTAWAASGALALLGDEDRPPVRIPVAQAFLHASADAAVGVLAAVNERERSGRGQHVDVSAQQSAMLAMQSYCLCDPVGAPAAMRAAGGLRLGAMFHRIIYPARDGFVAITFHFGSAIGPFSARLMQWIHEEGGCDAATAGKDWLGYTNLLSTGAEPRSEYQRVLDTVTRFTATRTKAELLEAALERRLLIAPVATLDEVLASEQLAARGFWRQVAVETSASPLADEREASAAQRRGDSKVVAVPGDFARFERSPLVAARRAPGIGEHTAEVLAWLETPPRASRAANHPPEIAPRSPAAVTTCDDRPLAGVKILDFLWVIAGPTATRMLADLGATVVRVESSRKLDTARTLAPYVGGQPGTDRSAGFHNLNAGKHMIALDPTVAEGRDVALDLVRWADVVCESFQPGTLERWQLGPEDLRAVKPDTILVRTSLMGQTGPLSRFAGYGNLAAALAGFSNLGGWPDRPPAGPFSAYTDYVTPRFLAVAILAALRHRDRTGEGQVVDVAQAECSLQFLAPALLEFGVHGRLPQRCGNADRGMAPHGVYPAREDESWIAIAAPDDASWRTLADAMARDDLLADAALSSVPGRLAAAERLDEAVAAWTRRHEAFALEGLLQMRGVPAAVVQTSRGLARDPHLLAREHFHTRESAAGAESLRTVVEGPRWRLSRTPARVGEGVPMLGRDSTAVLTEILGYDDERVTRVVLAGALE